MPPAGVDRRDRPAGHAVELRRERRADRGQDLAREPRVRGQQPLGGGEPHAGQVVDRVLHRPVVRVPQDGDGVGAAVRGARRAVRDRLRGDRRLDRRQRGGQRARHAREVAGLQPVEQHRDDGCRGEQRHTRPVDDRSGLGGAGVQHEPLAGGELRVHDGRRPRDPPRRAVAGGRGAGPPRRGSSRSGPARGPSADPARPSPCPTRCAPARPARPDRPGRATRART